jgi:hypothetical protein
MVKGIFLTLRERLCVKEVLYLWGSWVLYKLGSSVAQTVNCWLLITEGQFWLWAVLYVIWTWWQWDRLFSKSCHYCNTNAFPKQLTALLSNTFDKLSDLASQLSPWITVQFLSVLWNTGILSGEEPQSKREIHFIWNLESPVHF